MYVYVYKQIIIYQQFSSSPRIFRNVRVEHDERLFRFQFPKSFNDEVKMRVVKHCII